MLTIQEAIGDLQCGDELPCGCVIGSFLCPEAEALWARVMDTHRTKVRPACQNPKSEECARAKAEYDAAEEEYNQHFYEQRLKLSKTERRR